MPRRFAPRQFLTISQKVKIGGERGIRTLEDLRPTRSPSARTRPLCDLSLFVCSDGIGLGPTRPKPIPSCALAPCARDFCIPGCFGLRAQRDPNQFHPARSHRVLARFTGVGSFSNFYIPFFLRIFLKAFAYLAGFLVSVRCARVLILILTVFPVAGSVTFFLLMFGR